MKALQGMLRHANFQTTMNVYAGLDAEQMRESSRELGSVYAGIGSKSCRLLTGYRLKEAEDSAVNKQACAAGW